LGEFVSTGPAAIGSRGLRILDSAVLCEQGGVSPQTMKSKVDGPKGRCRLGDVVARAECERLGRKVFVPFGNDDDRQMELSRPEVAQDRKRVRPGLAVLNQQNVEWKRANRVSDGSTNFDYFN